GLAAQAYLLARGPNGLCVWVYTEGGWMSVIAPTADAPGLFPDVFGWASPRFYSTIQCADIDGDGQAEVIARSASSIEAYHFDRVNRRWTEMPAGPVWADGTINPWEWGMPSHYTTIQCANVAGNPHGQAYLLGRNSNGMETWCYDPGSRQWQAL